jgi:3-hexulose-6-phosphate synthase / 6-phospho-3-hexuloisomerase
VLFVSFVVKKDMPKPIIQVALDFDELPRALKLAEEAIAGGADWLEVGTPLLKSEGMEAVRALRKAFPDRKIVCDTKTMDAGRAEMEMAAKSGANVAVVMGVAPDETIADAVQAGKNYGIEVAVDLMGFGDAAARAKQVADLGVDIVCVHTPIDEQMTGKVSFERVRAVAEAVDVVVAVAGGINSETAAGAVAAGASIVIIGGALTKSGDARAAAAALRKAVDEGVSIETKLFKRAADDAGIREVFERVSVANISDGNHRQPPLEGLTAIVPGVKMVGRAVTVRTAPGDWAKPVEAIDVAEPGSVIVIAAGGVPPAVWGELATNSCIQKGLAGVLIDGAARDSADIRALGFPVFARHIVPNAGEPKGMGEIGVPVRVCGQQVCPGDWIIGDDDGVLVVPKDRAAEIANRGQDCLEKENRIRAEITDGNSTLARVANLLRWEKV